MGIRFLTSAIDADSTDIEPLDRLWDTLITTARLRFAFFSRLSSSSTRGVDRLSADGLRPFLADELAVVARKCVEGTYRFAPYLEVLQLKGRDKYPRPIAIATVRDRIVLLALKEILHEAFKDCVPRRLPNQQVREVVAVFSGHPEAHVVQADIKSFYEAIDHTRLFSILRSRLPNRVAVLLERAVRNASATSDRPRGSRLGLRRVSHGVPQGLAISNILAEIYVREIDDQVRPTVDAYFRYVDDILMLVKAGEGNGSYESLSKVLGAVGLQLANEKKHIGPISERFEYLGYELQLPSVSVRPRTLARLVDSLAAQFASYKHGSDRRYRTGSLDAKAQKRIFLDELNEKITGSVSENRRYGWLFYFLEINNVGVLYELDYVVRELWARFVVGKPPGRTLKRFVRAYFEARHNQLGSYIHNYNRYNTLKAKLAFLVRRGYLDPGAGVQYTDADIEVMFSRVKARNLSRLEADVGRIS